MNNIKHSVDCSHLTKLLTYGMTYTGLGLGLIMATFVVKDIPMLILRRAVLVTTGALPAPSYSVIRRKNGSR